MKKLLSVAFKILAAKIVGGVGWTSFNRRGEVSVQDALTDLGLLGFSRTETYGARAGY